MTVFRKKKKLFVLTVVMMLIGAMILTGCGQPDTPAAPSTPAPEPAPAPAPEPAPLQDVDLNLGTPFPATHLFQRVVLEPLVEEIAEKTDGRFRITIHPGGALSPGPAIYEDVSAGAFEMGMTMLGYTAGRFPASGVIEMPFMFSSSMDSTRVLWQLYEQHPAMQQEFADVKVVSMWTHDPGNIYSTDKPIRTLEDLSGMRTRFPGPVQSETLTALGAVPVGMPAGEIYDSLERGVLDGVAIANSGIKSFRLNEVIKHAVDVNLYVASFVLIMNKDTWNSLAPEDQQLIDSLGGEKLAMQMAEAYVNEYNEANQLMNDSGVEIYSLPPAEMARWQEAVAGPVVEGWINSVTAQGIPGQELYNLMLELAGY